MEEKAPKEGGFTKFIRILGMLMSFVYVTIGVAIYTKAIDIGLSGSFDKILGAGLVIYGGYRFYRAMKGNHRY